MPKTKIKNIIHIFIKVSGEINGISRQCFKKCTIRTDAERVSWKIGTDPLDTMRKILNYMYTNNKENYNEICLLYSGNTM